MEPDSTLTAREPQPSRGTGGITVFTVGLAALALLTSMVAAGFGMRAVDESKQNVSSGGGREVAEAPATAAVRLTEFKIEPSTVTVAGGGTIQLTNAGSIAHNLAVEGEGLTSTMLNGGTKGEMALGDLAPGSYKISCDVAGHKESGMTGSLTVTAGTGAASASMPAASAASHPMMNADQMDATMAAVTKAFPAKTEGLGGQVLAPTVQADGTKQFDITTKVVQWEVEPGKRVEAWTYNGTVPGPTIQIDPGDKVRVVLHNELPESTAIHIHGIDLPNAMDGVPDITQPPVKPGASSTYEFTAQTTPAVGMYHSHHNAAKQVSNGLAAAFLIGTEPVPAGVKVASRQTMMLNDAGTIGYSLNGKSFPATAPYTAKRGEWIEMHYMNEGVLAHPMHLHGMPQLVTAKDGFPLAQPYRADTVNVAPGERYTVLVQATAPGVWAWHCHILPHAERETGMFGMVTALIVE